MILHKLPANIAEAPENASSAFPEASLGEDKYFTFSLVTIKGGGPLTIK